METVFTCLHPQNGSDTPAMRPETDKAGQSPRGIMTNSLCYTSRGALAGLRNGSMGLP